MRRIGLFWPSSLLFLWLTSATLFAAEPLKDLRECSCSPVGPEFVNVSATKLTGDLTCTAPGCDQPDCHSAPCEAVAAACDSACGCCDDCLQCCNRWSVLAEAVLLRRSDSGSIPLILDQGTGNTLLNANNMEFDHQVMPRLQIMHENCCCWGWDFGIFGTDGWSTTETGGGNVSPVLVGPGIDFGSTAPGTVFGVSDSTSLLSGEINLRRRTSQCWTWLAGFRWITLSDELQAFSVAPTVTPFYSVDADNNLYGVQVGADAVLMQPRERFHIDGIFRVGLLGNTADQTTSSPVLANLNGFVGQVSADDDDVSFLGELGLRGVLQLTNSLAVTGGYQVLWLDGLALAPEQLPITSLVAPGSAGINTQGELVFYGATVGLQWTY